MEKIKRTIDKLFAVIAVAVALLLCGVLLGCGEKKPNDVLPSIDDGCGIVGPSGIFIKSEEIESETYNMNDVTLRFVCGIDIDLFNNKISEDYDWQSNDKTYEYGVFMYAYNTENYSFGNINGWHILDPNKIYPKLRTMDEDAVQDGVYLIEKLPYALTNELTVGSKTQNAEASNLITLDCLRDTAYEGESNGGSYLRITDDNKYEITCYEKRFVTLPRELFYGNSGEVEIRITAFVYSETDGSLISESSNIGSYDGSAIYRYRIDGDTVELTKTAVGGGEFIKDGTTAKVGTRKKQMLNISESNISIYDGGESLLQDVSAYTKVDGEVEWIDDEGNTHPARYIKIEANVPYLGVPFNVGTSYTDENGYYSIELTEIALVQELGLEIYVYASGEGVTVKSSSSGLYHYVSNVSEPDVSGTCAHVNLEFNMSTAFGKALQISQAALTAARYASVMNGSSLSAVNIIYPAKHYDKCFYSYNDKTICIIDSNGYGLASYASWDVIMHEYGHHVQNVLSFSDNPGTDHDILKNMADYFYSQNSFAQSECKSKGIRLAWSEGWANYFSILVQKYFISELENIDTVGDNYFQAYNIGVYIDIEQTIQNGDACEKTVMSFLWDLFDEYSASEPFDKIALSHEKMWNYVVMSHAHTLSEFVNYISDKLSRDDLAALLDRYAINANNLTFSYDSANRPTFSWSPRGGSQHYPNNKFDVHFYNADKSLLFSRTGVRTNSITLYDSEWLKLLEGCRDFYWTVDAYQIDDDKGGSCLTGPYITHLQRCDKLCESIEIGNTVSSSLSSGYAFYKFSPDKYINTKITLTCGNSLNCDVYTMPLVYSLNSNGNVHGSGSGTVVLYYEHLPSSWTSYIRVSGNAGAFTIKIEEHTHAYSSQLTPVDDSNHARTCACGSRSLEAHSFGKAVQMDSSNHKFTCACGYVKTVAHSFVTVGNRRRCLACGYSYLKPPGQDIMSVGDLC